MNEKHLNNPPIQEAILDIRVLTNKAVNQDKFIKAWSAIKNEFPEKQDIIKTEGSFGVIKGKINAPSLNHQLEGYLFKNNKNNSVIQFKNDGFSFNKLAPYSNWETFITSAEKYFNLYAECIDIETIPRIGLRYINRIKAPAKGELNDIFAQKIEFPAPIDGVEISSMFLRFGYNVDDLNGNLTIALSPTNNNGKSTDFIVDIEVVSANESATELSPLLPRFDKLRNLKNQIFFGAIHQNKLKEYK